MTGTEIFTAVDKMIAARFAKDDEALTAAVQDMKAAGLPDISVSPALGKFLYVLAKVAQARRILEIGTLGGYSTIWLARALPEDGRLITLELDPRHAEVARRNIARAKPPGRVDLREGPAIQTLTGLIDEREAPFDLIFIDADKESYTDYFRLSLELARRGTLIVADNVVRSGAIIDPVAAKSDPRVRGICEFLDALAGNSRVDATIMQSVGIKGYDGVALALVR